MPCYLCLRDFNTKRQPHCHSCARALLYEPRLNQASALLSRENSHIRAEAIVRPGNDGILAALPQDADWDAITGGIQKDSVLSQQYKNAVVEDRLNDVLSQAESLRRQMIQYRDQIENQKVVNAAKRDALLELQSGLAEKRNARVEPLLTNIRRTTRALQKCHQKASDAQAHLCYLAGCAMSLKSQVDHRRKPTGRFSLATHIVPDVRELLASSNHKESSETESELEQQQVQTINNNLINIARLVSAWSLYLSIRLPAEIVLPFYNFPHAVVLSEKASYKQSETFYQGLSIQDQSLSASKLSTNIHRQPRARPLYLDRSIAKLAREDAKGFGLFVEGVMLLAWDVAWLCRTQGITSINTFDDVCDVGRNLFLFHRAAELQVSNILKLASGRQISGPTSQFAGFSHDIVSRSLAGNEGASMLAEWRLIQPHRLVDKLRSYLMNEMTGAEWDVLSDRDFDDEREDEVAVLVGGSRRRRMDEKKMNISVMSVAPPENADTAKHHEKGWMKVRGRNNEAS